MSKNPLSTWNHRLFLLRAFEPIPFSGTFATLTLTLTLTVNLNSNMTLTVSVIVTLNPNPTPKS